MGKLLTEYGFQLPKEGDVIEGKVMSASKNEVLLDIGGVAVGLIRGPELFDESGMYSDLKVGDTVQATVLELENEKGQLELSFREAGHKIAWDELKELMEEGKIVDAIILDANKGGLIVRVGRVSGFLPVSQLTTEHYPRVEGGNKSKILERLATYMGQAFKVKVIDVNEKENKMIVSEKAAWEEAQVEVLSKYKVGDMVEGVVTGVVDFGAFVEFDEGLEGLVHISELAWQRIDDPRDIVKVGDKVKAQIIGIDKSKISLSIRRLHNDPWKEAVTRYNVEQVVRGKVLKLNPFGAFIELDKDIHGLAHISELSWKKINAPSDVLKVGETYDFKILSIEPDDHRLGLSLKATQEPPKSMKKEEKEEGEKSEAKEEKKEEIVEEKKEEVKEEPAKA